MLGMAKVDYKAKNSKLVTSSGKPELLMFFQLGSLKKKELQQSGG